MPVMCNKNAGARQKSSIRLRQTRLIIPSTLFLYKSHWEGVYIMHEDNNVKHRNIPRRCERGPRVRLGKGFTLCGSLRELAQPTPLRILSGVQLSQQNSQSHA